MIELTARKNRCPKFLQIEGFDSRQVYEKYVRLE